jgi:hypothetical protein
MGLHDAIVPVGLPIWTPSVDAVESQTEPARLCIGDDALHCGAIAKIAYCDPDLIPIPVAGDDAGLKVCGSQLVVNGIRTGSVPRREIRCRGAFLWAVITGICFDDHSSTNIVRDHSHTPIPQCFPSRLREKLGALSLI